jgi:hypothetical protein
MVFLDYTKDIPGKQAKSSSIGSGGILEIALYL